MTLEWIAIPSLFPEIECWGSRSLPEGGGYVVTHDKAVCGKGACWRATYQLDGAPERLGDFRSDKDAIAACETHLRKHRQ